MNLPSTEEGLIKAKGFAESGCLKKCVVYRFNPGAVDFRVADPVFKMRLDPDPNPGEIHPNPQPCLEQKEITLQF